MAIQIQNLKCTKVYIPPQDLIEMIISKINSQTGQNLQSSNISAVDLDEEIDATSNFKGLSIVFELNS